MSEFLTEKEVHELPEGSTVVVTWSGGNGPHEYTIIKDRYGYSCVDTCYQDRLDFIGDKSPFTTVRPKVRKKIDF